MSLFLSAIRHFYLKLFLLSSSLLMGIFHILQNMFAVKYVSSWGRSRNHRIPFSPTSRYPIESSEESSNTFKWETPFPHVQCGHSWRGSSLQGNRKLRASKERLSWTSLWETKCWSFAYIAFYSPLMKNVLDTELQVLVFCEQQEDTELQVLLHGGPKVCEWLPSY